LRRFVNTLFCPIAHHDNTSAFRRVRQLTRANGAKLTVLGLVPEASRLQRILSGSVADDLIQHRLIDATRKDLERRYQRRADPPVEVAVGVGNPASAIVERVATGNHDLVVVTCDDQPGGATTIRRLLRKCPCPVWVIRPSRARTQRVLAAVNPEPDEAALNHTIMQLARSMVEFGGGELHVVHAWEIYGESTLRSSAFMRLPHDQLLDLHTQTEAAHRRALDDLMVGQPYATAPWEVHLIKGPPGEAIPALVSRLRINLLVMGTVARTGVSGLLMGNTAEQILDDVRCSLIAVKPPGFASTITAGTR
jgi:universal stress protein E